MTGEELAKGLGADQVKAMGIPIDNKEVVIKKVVPKNYYNKDMYMEDAGSIALKAVKEIEAGLKKFGIELTPEQEDEFYVFIFEKLENYSNGDYRAYN